MEKLKLEWNVLAVGASLEKGTTFEFNKKNNPNISVRIVGAGTEEKAWETLLDTVKN